VCDIRRHCGDIACLHQYACTWATGVFIVDIPHNFVRQLHEPLNTIITVNDGQDVLLSRRAEQTIFAYRGDRRVPSYVRARQISKEIEAVQLFFKAGLSMNLWLILSDIGKGAVDRVALSSPRSGESPSRPGIRLVGTR